MADILKSLPVEVVEQERLKGATMSVYLRWMLIFVLTIALAIEILSGIKVKPFNSIILILLYFVFNVGLW